MTQREEQLELDFDDCQSERLLLQSMSAGGAGARGAVVDCDDNDETVEQED